MRTIDTIPEHLYRSSRIGFVPRLQLILRSFAHALMAAMARRKSRLELLELTDEQLRDIGISSDAAHREGSRPFWQ